MFCCCATQGLVLERRVELSALYKGECLVLRFGMVFNASVVKVLYCLNGFCFIMDGSWI